MYLTNHQLITRRTDTGGTTQQLGSMLEVVLWLVKQYGSTAFGEHILGVVQSQDADVASLMHILKHIWKHTEKWIRALIGEVWVGEQHHWYTITSPHVTKIAEKIWGEQQSVSESQKLELTVSWDGKIYKRSLDRDLESLLRA